jgi:hypothetical protein
VLEGGTDRRVADGGAVPVSGRVTRKTSQ